MPDDVLPRVVDALRSAAETTELWRRGLLHAGGPHRRLAGMYIPISIGEDECAVFGRLIEALRPAHAFCIGNAFGFSSAYIAAKMAQHGGERVVALDSQSEGDGERCARVAAAVADRVGASLLRAKKGWSPADIAASVETQVHQLVFIDGSHEHPQVTHDFDGILPFTNDRTVFVWHDYWLPGVPPSVDEAQRRGLRCLWLPTSCEMVLGVRDATVFARLIELFPHGSETFGPHGRWTKARVGLRTRTRFLWERWFGRTAVRAK